MPDLLQIKFSHWYCKLPYSKDNVRKEAELLLVIKTRFELLSERFKEFDTLYWDFEKDCSGHYQLPKAGDCLLLLFRKTFPILESRRDQTADFLFPTCRPWRDAQKEEYYRSMVGKVFEVVVEAELQ